MTPRASIDLPESRLDDNDTSGYGSPRSGWLRARSRFRFAALGRSAGPAQGGRGTPHRAARASSMTCRRCPASASPRSCALPTRMRASFGSMLRALARCAGVWDVVTGSELATLIGPVPSVVKAPVPYYPIAIDRARYVGEPVAVVVADDPVYCRGCLRLDRGRVRGARGGGRSPIRDRRECAARSRARPDRMS